MIVIVDYGLGNLASVRNALAHIGAGAEIVSDPSGLQGASGLILPGVGAASAGMERMRARRLDAAVLERAHVGTPILGLCLGMQLLFDRSEEGDAACLGLLAGTVRRMEGPVKVPHIGWNEVEGRAGSPMFTGLSERTYFYFVHSYICVPEGEAAIAGTTEYGETFASAVVDGSVWGTQFHPERSGEAGLRLLSNFAALCTPSPVSTLPARK
jgi:glutamine amidotransferase